MPQLILSKGNGYRSQLIRRIVSGFEPSPYFLVVSLVVFVVLITVITLTFSTSQVTKGYVLNSMDAKYKDLVKENEVQDMEISKVRSLQHIQESDKVRSMVKPGEVVYLNGDTAIASR